MKSLSFSDISTWARCSRAFYYRAIQRLKRRYAARPMRLGTLVHRLLADVYRGEQLELAMRALYSEELDSGELFEDEKEVILKDIQWAGEIVHRYFAQHPEGWEAVWEVLHVEEEFTLTGLGMDITLTPDLVVRDKNGDVWIVDHKTTVSIPQEHPFADLQALLYYLALHEIYGDALKGFIFNYLRKKTPTQPRLNKTGERRVTDLNRVDTTFEMLYEFLRDEAPDLLEVPDHRIRLAELRDTNKFFARHTILVSEEAMQSTVEDIKAHISAILSAEAYPRTFLSGGVRSCDRCEFLAVCQSDLLGWDTEQIIKEIYTHRPEKENEYDDEDE